MVHLRFQEEMDSWKTLQMIFIEETQRLTWTTEMKSGTSLEMRVPAGTVGTIPTISFVLLWSKT